MPRPRQSIVLIALLVGSECALAPLAHDGGHGGSVVAAAAPPPRSGRLRPLASGPVPRIVNGVRAGGEYPTVGMIAVGGFPLCSGALVGCRTFVTAGHCILEGTTASDHTVFLQHLGTVAVSTIDVHPDLVPEVTADLAVVTLASPVSGIAPSTPNTVAKPGPGSAGELVGFGGIEFPGVHAGVKRRGGVVTASCQQVADQGHVCWDFSAPLGPAGEDSSLCAGDGGAPLFADAGGLGATVAGVGAGISTPCVPDDVPWVTDLSFYQAFLESVAGSDLAPVLCGPSPSIGGPGTAVMLDNGSLDGAESGVLYGPFDPASSVPSPAEMRVVLNAELHPVILDYDLYVKLGAPPTVDPPDYDCASTEILSGFETCSLPSPAAGDWYVLIDNAHGDTGLYDLTISILGGAEVGPCAPLDGDGDGTVEALTDGLLALRHLLGFGEQALTAGVLGLGATRDAGEIGAFFAACGSALDVDGNGEVDPLTDGVLLLRYLFGFRGETLIDGVLGEGCTRCDAESIETYLDALTSTP